MEPIAPPNIVAHRQEWPARTFLSRISAAAANNFFSAGRFVRFDPRETMIYEGADDRTVYLLISGCVKVTSNLDAKSPGVLLAIRIAGDVVGELAAMDGQRRSASVQVCGRQPARVCIVEGEDFTRVLARHPDAHVVLSSVIGAKLRAATRRRIDIADCSPTVRMARVLVELAQDYGQPLHDQRGVLIAVNLRQVELGSLIGVSDPTAQRALRDLRKAGLIDTSQRPLIINDVERLRAAAAVAIR